MGTPWDDTLKTLIRTSPQAFIDWVAPGARFLEERRAELKNWKLEADTLLHVEIGEQEMLVHFEFQARNDRTMAERLLRYNVLIRSEYRQPVLSCVIYLLKDGIIQSSPLSWTIPTGQEVLQFHFQQIEMASLEPEDLLYRDQPGLLPLLPLTRGGATRAVVTEMLHRLEAPELQGLALIGCALAELTFRRTNPADVEWLKRRFRMLDEILRESSIFQEILQEGLELGREQGREQGLAEGREKGLAEGRAEGRAEGYAEAARQMLIEVTQARFPMLIREAQVRAAASTDAAELHKLGVEIIKAPDEAAARHLLNISGSQ